MVSMTALVVIVASALTASGAPHAIMNEPGSPGFVGVSTKRCSFFGIVLTPMVQRAPAPFPTDLKVSTHSFV